jgi:hypothetical protein
MDLVVVVVGVTGFAEGEYIAPKVVVGVGCTAHPSTLLVVLEQHHLIVIEGVRIYLMCPHRHGSIRHVIELHWQDNFPSLYTSW